MNSRLRDLFIEVKRHAVLRTINRISISLEHAGEVHAAKLVLELDAEALVGELTDELLNKRSCGRNK